MELKKIKLAHGSIKVYTVNTKSWIILGKTSGKSSFSWQLLIVYKWFVPPSTPEVAPISATLSSEATEESRNIIISPITISLYVLRTLPHKMTLFPALEATFLSITTLTLVVSTTPSRCRSLTTPLLHTTVRVGRLNSELLTIVLIFVLRCRCTCRW